MNLYWGYEIVCVPEEGRCALETHDISTKFEWYEN